MRPIPLKMRHQLAQEPRMEKCLFWGQGIDYGACSGGIEWDHVWIYGAKQINEPWAIVPLCDRHHFKKDGCRRLKEAVERASLDLATPEDLAKYPKKNWEKIKRFVNA